LPQALRQLDHALELSLLVVLADQVAHHVGAEAALRADGEALEGDMAARLVDAALERFERLKLGQLGRGPRAGVLGSSGGDSECHPV
jgi:hypothetical protein